jgi:hypothetical protein
MFRNLKEDALLCYITVFDCNGWEIRVNIYYIKMKVCMCVCMYVRRPAAGPTQPITPKFGVGSSFHPGSTPSQGATPSVDPRGAPYSDPV